jgi:trimeric autotransporter adhesin
LCAYVDHTLTSFGALLLALLIAGTAFAGTNVSGPIGANTVWSTGNAPYTVTNDVTVVAGAVLTVQPGVTVYMNAGTNLIISNGALSAQGTPVAPIVITSWRDIADPNPAPAAGDWGQLQFLSGTVASSTQLNNVAIKYGSGIALTAASPTLNNVSILSHSAPAITTDLQSSPVGSGNVAAGNSLNGILVPAGDIAGTVTWGLTGIPYVIAQGIVGVGAAAITISPTTLTLNVNATGTLHVTLATAAPAGGLLLNVSSSATAVATVPATVGVPQGATTVDVPVTAVAVGTATVSVSGGALGSAMASVQVNSAPTLTLSPAVGSVGIGQTLPMTVTASSAAPAGGVAVALSSSNTGFVTVPTPITIPANGTSANFNVTGVAVGTSTITAQASGYVNGAAAITAQGLTLVVPPNLLVAPGLSVGLLVRLSAPAPTGGVTVNLHSANSAIATVPASISVAGGATTAGVNVTGVAIGNTTITTSATGYASGLTSVAVSAITLDVAPSGTIAIPQGVTQAYQVTLSAPAPAGGVAVNVSSNGPSTATVSPSSVTIAPGQAVATGTVAVTGVASGSTSITLSSPGLASKTVNVTVLGVASLAFNQSAVVLGKGLMIPATGSNYLVKLIIGSNPFFNSVPVAVTLVSADPTKVSVPSSVTIPAGNGSARFDISGLDITSAPVNIVASAAGYQSTTTPLSASVVAPSIAFSDLDSSRLTTGPRDGFEVRWSAPDSNNPTQYGLADTAINLAVTNQNPVGIASRFYDASSGGNEILSLTIPTGGNVSGTAYIEQPAVAGTYTITASVPGLATSTSFVQTVTSPVLQLSALSVGVGLTTATAGSSTFVVSRTGPLTSAATVTLNCVPSTICAVPATVTIPAAAASVAIPVSGVTLGTATLTASAPGYPSASSTVTVEAPRFGSSGSGVFKVGNTVTLIITLQSSTGKSETSPTDVVLGNFTSSPPNLVSVPSTGTIVAGSTSVQLSVPCLNPGTVTINWTSPGFSAGGAIFTVSP